ncbi:41866_t:CDS:2, partial [Gigaspora margarita]
MKDNSILLSNLTQTIYKSLISIPEIDENLEGDIGFSLNVVNVSSKINTENKLATIKINHQLLYPQPENIATTNEIKKYITNNLDYIASKLYKNYMRSVLTKWFLCLRNHRIDNIKIFLSDKNFAQISSAQAVWENVNIQLCKWHVNRAIKQKLLSSKIQHGQVQEICNYQIKKTNSKVFCVQFYRNIILELVEKHLRQHMLLPTNDKEFINDPQQIRKFAIKEIFEFCHTNNLFDNLWAISSNPKIFPLLTAMIVESYWRILKRDYLYKFNRPQLDLVCFILINQMISGQIQHYNLLINGRKLLPLYKDIKSEWKKAASKQVTNKDKYLVDHNHWICSCCSFLKSRFYICKHLVAPIGMMDNINTISNSEVIVNEIDNETNSSDDESTVEIVEWLSKILNK